jgi:hypothetical protein
MVAAVAAKPARGQATRARETIADPVTVGSLLDTAFGTYKAGHLASQIASLMRARTDDPPETEAINRREISAYLAEAAASVGELFLHAIARNRTAFRMPVMWEPLTIVGPSF